MKYYDFLLGTSSFMIGVRYIILLALGLLIAHPLVHFLKIPYMWFISVITAMDTTSLAPHWNRVQPILIMAIAACGQPWMLRQVLAPTGYAPSFRRANQILRTMSSMFLGFMLFFSVTLIAVGIAVFIMLALICPRDTHNSMAHVLKWLPFVTILGGLPLQRWVWRETFRWPYKRLTCHYPGRITHVQALCCTGLAALISGLFFGLMLAGKQDVLTDGYIIAIVYMILASLGPCIMLPITRIYEKSWGLVWNLEETT